MPIDVILVIFSERSKHTGHAAGGHLLSIFTPLDGTLKAQKCILSFDPDVAVSRKKSAVFSFLGQLNPFRARVIGEDANGLEEIVDYVKNIDSFGNFDFDAVADESSLDLTDIKESPFLKNMATIMQEHAATFEMPITE